MAAQQTVTEVEQVSAAAARSFATRGQLVVEMPFDRFLEARGNPGLLGVHAVVVSELRRLELVIHEEAEPARLAASVRGLADSGWDVCVLVPGAMMGDAHSGLRGAPCTLQQWWFEDDVVCFGRVELP